MPSLIIFDLDKTLARSKEPLTASMVEVLVCLLERTRVAIISGGAFPQFLSQVILQLPSKTKFENLYILPTSGGALHSWEHEAWHIVYEKRIPQEEIERIITAVRSASSATKLIDFNVAGYGERIEDRGAQITLSALGQQAPIDAKEAWDPDGAKKRLLRTAIAEELPEYDVKTGGSTSIDITLPDVNKAFGVQQLSQHLNIHISDMLYIGDALYPGGNDAIVKETGILTKEVSDPSETEKFIRTLLFQN